MVLEIALKNENSGRKKLTSCYLINLVVDFEKIPLISFELIERGLRKTSYSNNLDKMSKLINKFLDLKPNESFRVRSLDNREVKFLLANNNVFVWVKGKGEVHRIPAHDFYYELINDLIIIHQKMVDLFLVKSINKYSKQTLYEKVKITQLGNTIYLLIDKFILTWKHTYPLSFYIFDEYLKDES